MSAYPWILITCGGDRPHGTTKSMFDHAEDVFLSGLSFDYHRPTVSEFTVTDAAAAYADVRVHPDSTYALENGKL